MALTQITSDSIADSAITQQKINPSVQLGGGGVCGGGGRDSNAGGTSVGGSGAVRRVAV